MDSTLDSSLAMLHTLLRRQSDDSSTGLSSGSTAAIISSVGILFVGLCVRIWYHNHSKERNRLDVERSSDVPAYRPQREESERKLRERVREEEVGLTDVGSHSDGHRGTGTEMHPSELAVEENLMAPPPVYASRPPSQAHAAEQRLIA